MISESKIDVRYPDADQMGIVHHAVYPLWLEIARMDYFAALGTPYTETHALGIDPAMVNMNLDYLAPAHYPDTVRVRTRAVFYAPKKLKLAYEVFDGEGKLLLRATTFHIWTGPDMKSLDMEQTMPDFYAAIAASVEPE